MSLFKAVVVGACAYGASAALTSFPPTVKSVSELGHLSTPGINRDSCGSTRMFGRVLWVCRDTQPINDTSHRTEPKVWSSSASWANFTTGHVPSLNLYGGNGSQTGYYPYASDECPVSSAKLEGTCSDNTRYALWPDSPPLITSNVSGVITAYTWIRQSHIRMDLSNVVNDPATSLYKVVYQRNTRNSSALPTTSLVKEGFWVPNNLPYGSYGNLVSNGTAYLFGQSSNGTIGLAKVPANKVQDISSYQYYVGGAWTSTIPDLSDPKANVANAGGGGQGTFFYSSYWSKYVWIGQGRYSVSPDFLITVSDNIEGPWESPVSFYSTKGGTFHLPGYSLQAHPSLSNNGLDMDSSVIWISYSKVDNGPSDNVYSHPLIKVTFT